MQIESGRKASALAIQHDGTNITVAQLLTMRSGLYGYTDDPTLPWYLWLAITTTRSKATLRGFAKKTEVFMMCRAVGGDTDDQPFSTVVSRVVQ